MTLNESLPLIENDELWKHNTSKSSWMALNGIVYDITTFLAQHPGGSGILLKYSGTDASAVFGSYHPPDMVAMLPAGSIVGRFSAPKSVKKSIAPIATNIPIGHILNSYDFADNARSRVSKEAWDYLVSAADDEVTYRQNEEEFNKYWIKPRILKNVSGAIDISVNLFGTTSSCPIFVSATAMGRLYHADGEAEISRGCALSNIVQMCPTLASCSMEEMANKTASQWFQLYVNRDRKLTEKVIRKAESLGMKVLVITVDVAVLGKRERDERNKHISANSNIQQNMKTDNSRGISRALSSFIHSGFDWNELKWIRSITTLPILLKGVQTKEDALLAYHSGLVQGIIVSNHGGRQIDFARPSLVCLEEIIDSFNREKIPFNQSSSPIFDIYVDGGVRRGTDVFKALALGAKAVGIGRPAIFALASHGAEGVAHLVDILSDELRMTMMHCGCTSLKAIGSQFLAKSLHSVPRVVDDSKL